MTYTAATTAAEDAVAGRFNDIKTLDYCFLGVYWAEALLKVYGLGPTHYWINGWNRCASVSISVCVCVCVCVLSLDLSTSPSIARGVSFSWRVVSSRAPQHTNICFCGGH